MEILDESMVNILAVKMENAIFSEKCALTLLHSERPKLYTILDFLSAIELKLGFGAKTV